MPKPVLAVVSSAILDNGSPSAPATCLSIQYGDNKRVCVFEAMRDYMGQGTRFAWLRIKDSC
jgi:hypothetical protein